MTDMQTVTPKRGIKIIHVETELGIVNIYLKLTDRYGRKVEAIGLRPDCLAGKQKVKVIGHRFVQLKARN